MTAVERRGHKILWDEARLAQLYTRGIRGESTAVLAAEAGVKADTLHKAWGRRGLSMRSGKAAMQDGPMRALFERVLHGETVESVSASSGMSGRALTRRWNVRGWFVRRDRMALHLDALKALFDRHERGESARSLSAESGRPITTLLSAWSRHGWTVKKEAPPRVATQEIHALWERHIHGQKTSELAGEIGRTSEWLCKRWKALGYDPAAHTATPQLSARSKMYISAWGMRTDGFEWKDIAAEVGYTGEVKSLKACVRAWCDRNGIARLGTVEFLREGMGSKNVKQ